LEITSNDVLEWYKTVEKFTYTLNDLQEMLIAVVDYRNNVGHWISSNEVDLL
jgi:elongation factor P--beta-lysine ligase